MKIKNISCKQGKYLMINDFPLIDKTQKELLKRDRYLIKCGDNIYNMGGLEDDRGSVMSRGITIYYFHAK